MEAVVGISTDQSPRLFVNRHSPVDPSPNEIAMGTIASLVKVAHPTVVRAITVINSFFMEPLTSIDRIISINRFGTSCTDIAFLSIRIKDRKFYRVVEARRAENGRCILVTGPKERVSRVDMGSSGQDWYLIRQALHEKQIDGRMAYDYLRLEAGNGYCMSVQ